MEIIELVFLRLLSCCCLGIHYSPERNLSQEHSLLQITVLWYELHKMNKEEDFIKQQMGISSQQ